ncbi:MAG TPA: FAD-dependent oxidoreductase [Candidatus Dietzia intestinigallinarum]|nr:FAD-dependent oxidoreductase [Candidatus Dietzia intestinigallinarum]
MGAEHGGAVGSADVGSGRVAGVAPGPERPLRVVVVGAGMAAARLAEELRAGQPDPGAMTVTVLGAEAEEPYNRIMLSHLAATGGPELPVAWLKPTGWWERHHVALRTSTPVVAIDRPAREVLLGDGERLGYDHLVLATGAQPRIPPVEGIRVARSGPGGGPDRDLAPGVFTLRDVAGARALTAHLSAHPGPVAVVGGGFIGLEVACAMAAAGHEVTVVHPRDRPMNGVLDAGAGSVLVRALAAAGVRVRTGVRATRWDGGRLELDDDEIACRTVVLTAGSAPRADVARAAGLAVDDGVVVNDSLLTCDPAISAIGDCAQHRGVVGGLVAPAWEQATVVAARLTGVDPSARYTGGLSVTRLKASGLDVVALGELTAEQDGPDSGDEVEVTTISEPARCRYARVDVVGGRIVGAALVGHPEPVGMITQLYEDALPLPEDMVSVILGRAEAVAVPSPATMPATAVVCRCNGVRKSDLVAAWGDGARDRVGLAERTRAGTGCGGCSSAVDGICGWLREAG